jgi:hypothetical protein
MDITSVLGKFEDEDADRGREPRDVREGRLGDDAAAARELLDELPRLRKRGVGGAA